MAEDRDSQATVLLLASPHLSEDGWDEDRETEAKEVAERLSQFKPTDVAVEVRPQDEARVQERYGRFLAGVETLKVSEIDQIAFRLAQLCNIQRIRGFDADWQLDWSGLRILYPNEADLENAFSAVTVVSAPAHDKLRDLITSRASLREVLLWVNSREYQEIDHRSYIRIAEMGTEENSAGAQYTASWYLRNLRMYANLARLARPGLRLVAIIGAGHAKILNDLLRQSASFNLVDPLVLLG